MNLSMVPCGLEDKVAGLAEPGAEDLGDVVWQGALGHGAESADVADQQGYGAGHDGVMHA
jgi:hypothetical protein